MKKFNLLGIKLSKEKAVNCYSTIFDHAESNKTNIFKLCSLNFGIFNDLALPFWALIVGCYDFFCLFLENV